MYRYLLLLIALFFLSGCTLQNKPEQQVPTGSPDQLNPTNPASTYCVRQGGQTVIMKKDDQSEYGLCLFDDNRACEEWAMFNKECPLGGVKTTGYTTISQKYCAWLGGQTLALENSNCTLPSGRVCDFEELYNDTCIAKD